ncbi:MAG: trigger factor family protein [Candidatus Shapirobacteria bacterium]|jgi:FKBP-type peptidyl-prolyl cis-trans isomerase (trigger factor)
MAFDNFRLTQKNDRSFELTGTVTKSEIDGFRQQALAKLQKELNLPGFRPGKAPLNMVASNYDESTIFSETINIGLTAVYRQLIDKFELKPIVPPTIDFKSPPSPTSDSWEVIITSCLEPTVTLTPNYLTQIKKLKKDKDQQKNVDTIMALIEKNSTLVFPQPLLDHEWEHYLEDNKIDPAKAKDLKNDYGDQLKRQWLLNLALNAIGQEHKINLTAEDLKNIQLPADLVKSNPQMAIHLLLQDKIVKFLIENIPQA